MRRIERDDPASLHVAGLAPGALEPEAAIAPAGDGTFDGSSLPADHPKWAHDGAAISSRARALLARLRPVVVRVLTMWDHRVRAAAVAGRRLVVDLSGCYRVES